MFVTRKWVERRIDDAYGDGVAAGLEMGIMAAETRIRNYIAQIEGADFILDALDEMDLPEDE